jgi:diamine N-acetyltransferase
MTLINFTLLTVANASALSELAIRAYRDHYLDLWHDEGAWYIQHSFAPYQLATELADPNARYFRIDLERKPVGFLKVNLDNPLPGSPLPNESAVTDMELERIYLVDAATGQGVGQAAMNFVEMMARERGKQTLWLKSMDNSLALGFYKRLGFQQHGTHRLNFSQMKAERRGMVILKKLVE